jgi:hypothetical protein
LDRASNESMNGVSFAPVFNGAASSWRGSDVLVETEQICRIIFVFQCRQSSIFFGAVGGLDPFGTLVRLIAQS